MDDPGQPSQADLELAREFVLAEEELATAKRRWSPAFTALRLGANDDIACRAVAQIYAQMGISPSGDYGRVMVQRSEREASSADA